jgi:hypothetical protein
MQMSLHRKARVGLCERPCRAVDRFCRGGSAATSGEQNAVIEHAI